MSAATLTVADIAVEGLSRRVVAEVEALSGSLEPQFVNMASIRRIITEAISEKLEAMGFADKLLLVASLPELAGSEVEMTRIHFTVDEYFTAAAKKALEERLQPLQYTLTFAHYEGRILPIMQQAGAFASELARGPAARCVKEEAVTDYQGGIAAFLSEATVPPDDYLDRILRQGFNFFGLLATCLENREWGEPAGLTEETVGYPAYEVRSWTNMMGDLQHLNLRKPMAFSEALAAEISELGPPEVACA
jgi:hypothetical protein